MASIKSTRGIVWVDPPDKLAKAYEQFGMRVLVAAHAVGSQVGAKMQNHARRHASWEDRTGNARGGLFFVVDGLGAQQKRGKVQPGKKKEDSRKEFVRNLSLEEVEGGDTTTLVVFLAHAMGYGLQLETAHGQKYAIIWPTISGVGVPEMRELLKKLFEEL